MQRRPLLSLFLIAPLAACGEAAAQDPGPGEVKSIELKELERITDEIRAEVEELRGEKFAAPVKVAIAGPEEFRAYVKARMDVNETPEELAADEEVAKLCGVLPADFDYLGETLKLIESQVGGFYDPETKTFYLMRGFGGDVARIILAHELTHALDDQLFGLDDELEVVEDDTDAEWAYYAVIEGSGTAVMNLWTMKNVKSLDLSSMQELTSMGMDELKNAPPFLWRPLVGAYTQGEQFLKERPDALDLSAAIRRVFEAPPRSSEEVLHPMKYWAAEVRDDPKLVRFDRSALPQGWDVRDEDTLGELGLGMVVEPLKSRHGLAGPMAVMSARYTSREVQGWGGDRYVLLGRGEQDRLLLLATVWDTEKDALEFAEGVEALREHFLAGPVDALDVRREGASVDVVLARGAGAEVADAVRKAVRLE
jgi:hypothetical protein